MREHISKIIYTQNEIINFLVFLGYLLGALYSFQFLKNKYQLLLTDILLKVNFLILGSTTKTCFIS